MLTSERTYVLVSTIGPEDWQIIDRFDLEALEVRPRQIIVIGQSTIESERADEIAAQAAAITQAISQLEANTGTVADELVTVL